MWVSEQVGYAHYYALKVCTQDLVVNHVAVHEMMLLFVPVKPRILRLYSCEWINYYGHVVLLVVLWFDWVKS